MTCDEAMNLWRRRIAAAAERGAAAAADSVAADLAEDDRTVVVTAATSDGDWIACSFEVERWSDAAAADTERRFAHVIADIMRGEP